MDSSRALRHLIFTFEMSLGEHEIEDRTLPIARDLVYLVFFRWFTRWPPAKIKGKDFLCPEPKGDFASEQRDLLAVMARYVDALEREPARRTVNPGLGTISLRKWSRVHGVHTDHHLRQFGV